jgi:parallel beta-helix repeat protein
MGGGGLALYSDTRDNSIIGNVFQDISGGAVDVDLALAGRSQRDVIQNNYITRATRNYRGGAGIFGGYPADLLIEHNEITDLPGGGVNVGWGWTTADTNLKNNLIRYNRIHNVLNITEDNAGIYTLSKQPGTKIFENYLYDITVKGLAGSWRNAFGIYLDEGSSVMTVENNVVENVFVGLYLHQSSNNTIINFTGSVRNQSSGNDSFITTNTFDVAKVKATAGIEAAYRDIIPSSAAGQDTTPPVAPTNLRILQ